MNRKFILIALGTMSLGIALYYSYHCFEQDRIHTIAEQESALVAGFAISVRSLGSPYRLHELRQQTDVPFEHIGRITDILIIDEQLRITDSLDPRYVPRREADGTVNHALLSEVSLPPIINCSLLPSALDCVSQASTSTGRQQASGSRAIALPVETTEGRIYIVVAVN